jgi:hypothetical protein
MKYAHVLMRSVLVAALALAGCGDDGAGAPDAAHFIDAAPDAISIDAAPDGPNLPVVGDWRYYDPSAPTGTFKSELDLRASHQLVHTFSDHTFNGTWDVLADGRLHTMEGSFPESGYYFVNATRLVTGAFIPSGTISGVVGTWTAHDNFGNDDTSRVIELRADLSLSLTFTGSSPLTATGSYIVDGTHLVLSLSNGSQFNLVALPDAAIGQSLYERL